MAYYALITGQGNRLFERIGAKTLEGATEIVLNTWRDAILGSHADGGIEEIVIVEGTPHTIDLDAIRKKAAAEKNTDAYKAKEAAERAEYERLKMKFEPVAAREIPGLHPNRSAKGGDWDGDCG